MNNKVYLWKDVDDKNSFHVGVPVAQIGSSLPYMAIWLTLPIDAIEDIFGEEIKNQVTNLEPGHKTEVEFTLKMIK